MRTKPSTAKRIRAMLDIGHTNKAIIEKLQCKPQAVYNIRYQVNKARGLGSIGALKKPTNGIGAPPKRKYVRKGTGIADWAPMPELQITVVEPTLWQRIKQWFRG
jgi:hypothetical protein